MTSEIRQLDPSEIFQRYLDALARAEAAERAIIRITTVVAYHLDRCAPCECSISLRALAREPRP